MATTGETDKTSSIESKITLASGVLWANVIMAGLIGLLTLAVRGALGMAGPSLGTTLYVLLLIGVLLAAAGSFSFVFATMLQTPQEEANDTTLVAAGTLETIKDAAQLAGLRERRSRVDLERESDLKVSDLVRWPIIAVWAAVAMWAVFKSVDMVQSAADPKKALAAYRDALPPTLGLIALLLLAGGWAWWKRRELRALGAGGGST